MDYRQTILNAIEGRKRLEKVLADTLRRHELLTGRMSELEVQKNALAGELAVIDEKIKQAACEGKDAGDLMHNRNSLVVAISDAAKMIRLTKGPLDQASADVENAKMDLARGLQAATMRVRDIAATDLQRRLDGVGSDLTAWTNAVYETATALGVEVPGGGTDIVLSGRNVDYALSRFL